MVSGKQVIIGTFIIGALAAVAAVALEKKEITYGGEGPPEGGEGETPTEEADRKERERKEQEQRDREANEAAQRQRDEEARLAKEEEDRKANEADRLEREKQAEKELRAKEDAQRAKDEDEKAARDIENLCDGFHSWASTLSPNAYDPQDYRNELTGSLATLDGKLQPYDSRGGWSLASYATQCYNKERDFVKGLLDKSIKSEGEAKKFNEEARAGITNSNSSIKSGVDSIKNGIQALRDPNKGIAERKAIIAAKRAEIPLIEQQIEEAEKKKAAYRVKIQGYNQAAHDLGQKILDVSDEIAAIQMQPGTIWTAWQPYFTKEDKAKLADLNAQLKDLNAQQYKQGTTIGTETTTQEMVDFYKIVHDVDAQIIDYKAQIATLNAAIADFDDHNKLWNVILTIEQNAITDGLSNPRLRVPDASNSATFFSLPIDKANDAYNAVRAARDTEEKEGKDRPAALATFDDAYVRSQQLRGYAAKKGDGITYATNQKYNVDTLKAKTADLKRENTDLEATATATQALRSKLASARADFEAARTAALLIPEAFDAADFVSAHGGVTGGQFKGDKGITVPATRDGLYSWTNSQGTNYKKITDALTDFIGMAVGRGWRHRQYLESDTQAANPGFIGKLNQLRATILSLERQLGM